MRHIACALLVGVVAAAGLSAQEDVAVRLAGRVSPEVASAVQELAAAVAARGLPVEPLVQKAIEGGAKGVAAQRILSAVRVLVDQLDQAAGAIRAAGIAQPDAETVEAGAFALGAGLGARQISELVRASKPPHTPAATLRVAALLAALGVPSKETADLVRQAIAAGRSPREILDLSGQVQAGMARGATPAAAAAGLARAAARGPAAEPRRPPPDKGNPHRP